MFYPVDSLRRGGRFHFCWIADSWPHKFACMTHRQLKSQNIVQICDDLLQVINEESRRPSHRFSLRLSSQLLRGLTRIYEKKTNIFLADLCMLTATILKHSNHRFDTPEKKRKAAKPLPPASQFAENILPIDNVETLLQNSENVVARIADITLIEIPPDDAVKAIADGFGIEDEQMQNVFMGPEEMRQAQDKSSVLEDISNIEASKLQVSIEAPVQIEHGSMEEPSNVTMAPDNRSLPTVPEIEVDLIADKYNISKVPEEEYAEKEERLTAPKVVHSTPLVAEDQQDKPATKPKKLSFGVPIAEVIADETLQSIQPATPVMKRRRRPSKLIVDTQMILATSYMQSRLVPHIDITCEFQDVAIQLNCCLPPDQYLKRPAHSFASRRQLPLTSHCIRHFQRNLVAIEKKALEEREREFILAGAEADKRLAQETSIDRADTTTMARVSPLIRPIRDHSFMQQKKGHEQVEPSADISNLPTEVLHGDQTIIEEEATAPAYRISRRTITFRGCNDELEGLVYDMVPKEPSPKKARLELEDKVIEVHTLIETIAEVHHHSPVADVPISRPVESFHPTSSPPVADSNRRSSLKDSQTVNELLLVAGLADKPETGVQQRSDSDSTETPLGSLDRTAVSLGESVATTDSRRFLRKEWGSEATLLKIIKQLNRDSSPLTLSRLLESGTQNVNNRRAVATACFTSLLKLKHAGFIKVSKQDNSNNIDFIELGDLLYEEEFLQ